MDGDVLSGYVGTDYHWTDRVVAGVAVAQTKGTGSVRTGTGQDRLRALLTSVYPYAQWAVRDNLRVWGLLGAGVGDLQVTGGHTASAVTTDLGLRMAAVGAEGDLPALGDVALRLKADGMLVDLTTDAVTRDVARLAALTTNAQRARLVLAGERPWTWAGGERLVPSVELGARYDGGDADTGLGAEVGAGLVYTHPAWGPAATGPGVWGTPAGDLGPTPGPGGGRVDVTLGYGVRLGAQVLTPFGEGGLTGAGTRRLQVGTRLALPRAGLTLALFGEERTRPTAPTDYLLGLTTTGQF